MSTAAASAPWLLPLLSVPWSMGLGAALLCLQAAAIAGHAQGAVHLFLPGMHWELLQMKWLGEMLASPLQCHQSGIGRSSRIFGDAEKRGK